MRIEDYLCKDDPDKDYTNLIKLLQTHSKDLRTLFDIYCNYANGNSQLSVLNWILFTRNLKINDKNFTNFQIRQILNQQDKEFV